MPLRKKLLKDNAYALMPLCEVCGGMAYWGFEVSLQAKRGGFWYCSIHKDEYAAP